jgi:outer membrane protein assembly factor BamD (BamD/ComL family)
MKRLFSLIFLLLIACGPGPQELFETAEFELLQTNYPHATKLYQEIIDQHPDSELVEKARARLKEIKARQEAIPSVAGK